MTLAVISPAPPSAILELAPPFRRYRGGTLHQARLGQTVAVYAGDRPIAVVYLVPDPWEGEAGVWQICLSIDRAAVPYLPRLIRALHLRCAAIADHGITIRAHVRPGNRAGQRMARLAGFRRGAHEDGSCWVFWRG